MEILLGLVLSGIIGYFLGSHKGMGAFGFLVSALLGPIGWLLVLVSKGNVRKCPYCGEGIRFEATICKHCRSKVDPATRRDSLAKIITAIVLLTFLTLAIYWASTHS